MNRARNAILVSVILALVAWMVVPTNRHREVGIEIPPSAEKVARANAFEAPKAPVIQDLTPGREEVSTAPVAAKTEISPAPEKLAAFRDWSEQYVAASPTERGTLIAKGVELARQRQPEFLRLIKQDPDRALEEAVPWLVRQNLPAEVVALLEERVNTKADVRTYMSTPIAGAPTQPTLRYAKAQDGRNFQVHATGEEKFALIQQTGRSTIGVALPEANGLPQLALSTKRAEPLPVGFRVPAGTPVKTFCPVSGQQSADAVIVSQPLTETTPAVQAEGEIVYLCNGSHTKIYDQDLLYAEGSNGGPQPFTGALPHATSTALGALKVLYIPMTFLDQNATPASEATCYSVMKQVSDYYTAQSFGKLTILTTVTPPVRLPHTEAWYIAKDAEVDGLGLEHADARAAVRAMGYDTNAFNTIVVRLNGGPRATGGWGGGNSVWTYYDDAGIVGHEIGHTFGLAHANFWDTTGKSAIGSGASQEYGDSYDVMGGGGVPKGQYNIWAKQNLGWLKPEQLWNVTASGTYRIYAHDANLLDPQRRYGLNIVKDAQRTYWVETRQIRDADSGQQWLKNGAILEWRWSAKAGNNLLIDTTPGSPSGKPDGVLVVGRTFSDYEAGIHFTPIGVTPAPAGGQKSVDMVVNVGRFPGNAAPVLTVNASGTTVATNTAVTFDAVATDADGDALAYFWTFGDGVIYPNAAQITRTFSSAGTYTLTCTASDMKGGTSTKRVVMTVGTPANYAISGQVTLGGVPAANVVVGNGSKDTVTDDAGNYTLAGLAAGTFTVTPRLDGYTFTAASVTVGPNQTGISFDGAAGVLLTLSAPTPTCVENVPGTPGVFRLTRTGDTAAALTVQVQALQGTATSGTDYNLLPAISASTFVIPAGAASLDITLTPVNDAAAEGPETAILQVVPDAAYIITGNGDATVTIADDDSALPLVNVKATVPFTTEGSASPGLFTIARAGTTTGALAVNYTVSGTATNGTDYTTLSGSITIPAGASSVTVPVSTLQDTANEGNETVVLTLTSNAAYLLTSSTAATVTINDDDLQVITVTTPDATAAETTSGAPDTATFQITRTGDTSQPLTLYYALSGTAQHGVDYALLPGSVTMGAGASTATITITPIADGLGEGSETVTLQMASLASGYTLASVNNNTITIADNSADKPYVEVIAIDGYAVESGDTGRFRFTATGGSGAFAVNYTVSGTATNGTDYTLLSGTANLPTGTGARTVDVTVTPKQDTELEDLETIIVTITPSANYTTWAPADSAMMWLRDDDQPTVFVDAHSTTPTEAGTASSFYISRVGSTTGALTVNYTMSGTATNGADYVALSGTATIPDAAAGVDVAITPIQDVLAEGTETITMTLAPGAYSRTPESSTLYLTDDDTLATKVQFASAGASGSESVGTVNIPVTLTQAAAGNVTVEYYTNTGTTSSTSLTANKLAAPYWVRMVRAGTTFTSYSSPDGLTWTQLGTPQTISMASASYRAGLAVTAANDGQLSNVVFDNVSITGLSPGGTQGTVASQDIGSVAAAGSDSTAGGIYNVAGSGSDISSTADEFRYVSWPITDSLNCTVTARVVSQSNTASGAKAGVMIRETTAANAREAMTGTTPATGIAFLYRPTAAATTTKVLTSNFTLPYWVRLVRAGDVITAYRSFDGIGWAYHSQVTIPIGGPVYAGLAVSSVNDGTKATGVFDNVSITGGGTFASRDVGAVAATGSYSEAGGVHTVIGSGADIFGSNDEFQFAWKEMTGDFTLTARVVSLTNTSSSAKAGVEIRESFEPGARHALFAARPDGTTEFITRASGLSTATGSGDDYDLPTGTLTFTPGQTTQNIPLTIRDDIFRENNERIIIKLRNASGAGLGAITEFVYSIGDNDGGTQLPVSVGFAQTSSSGQESQSAVSLPVVLSAPAATTITVNYAVTGGNADPATDFTLNAGTLTFAPGETQKNISIAITGDAFTELNETIVVSLSAPSAAVLNGNTAHTYTILNDDGTPSVTIDSPTTAAANVPSGVGLVLESTPGSLPGTITAAWTKVSGPGTVTFGNAASFDTTANFSAPGTYVLRITATSAPLSAQSDVTVNYGYTDYGFPITAVGSATPAPTAAFAGGTYTLIAGGDGIPSSAVPDAFGYYALPVTGNVSITARITSVQAVDGSNSRAGVMIRESLASDSTEAFVGITSLVSGRSIFRLTTAASSINSTATVSFPYWVRLTRTGNSFVTEFAPDVSGSPGTYTTNSTQTIAMSSAAYVGLAATSGNNGTAGTTVMDHVTISQALVNIAPLVSAGNVQTIGIASTSLTGSASDDGHPSPLSTTWSAVSGPGTVTFGNAASPTSTATFGAGGTYVLRLVANDGNVKTFGDTTITVNLPTVTVIEADAVASEFGNDPGAFTVSRTGSTTAPLTVHFTLTGTATEGADYQTVGTTVVIPVGAASANVTIRPIPDQLVESYESAVLTLQPDPAYAVDADPVATVSINDSPVDQWRYVHFGVNSGNFAISGDNADPDHDGIPNLVEYAVGSDPNAPALSPAVLDLETIASDQFARLTIGKNPAALDVVVTVEVNPIPTGTSGWTTAGTTVEIQTGTTLRVRDNTPVSGAGKRGLRVKVTRP